MANNNKGFMQQAREALQNLTNTMTNNNTVSDEDVNAVRELIQQAYNESLTPEEEEELKELENKINNEFK